MKSICAYSESDLVFYIKQNNKDAFCYLYDHYAGALMYTVSRYVADEAHLSKNRAWTEFGDRDFALGLPGSVSNNLHPATLYNEQSV